jgi:hypothetical protein
MKTTTTQATYYDKEFIHLENFAGFLESSTMKIQNEYGATRWMNVTPEQISAILEILNQQEG